MAQTAIVIPEKIYFKIGEVCDLVGVQAHVLRYWETEFPMLSPQKNRSGQRSYRRRDVEIAVRIKELLYDEMYTIAGAKKKLQTESREATKLKVVSSPPQEDVEIGLFDEDEETEGISLISDQEVEALSEEQREALTTLTTNLFELREMLKGGRQDS